MTLQAGIAVVAVKTEDLAVIVNGTRGVDNSRLIARTFSTLVSYSVAVVADRTLVTVVTYPRDVNSSNNNMCSEMGIHLIQYFTSLAERELEFSRFYGSY